MEYPPGTAPSEIFEKSLEKVKGFWYDEVVSSKKGSKLTSGAREAMH